MYKVGAHITYGRIRGHKQNASFDFFHFRTVHVNVYIRDQYQ